MKGKFITANGINKDSGTPTGPKWSMATGINIKAKIAEAIP
jgi:hypothetical protein